LPDQRWRPRRLLEARPIRRGIAHLLVIALVVASAAAGISFTANGAPGGRDPSFELVARARGAAAVDLAQSFDAVTYQLTPDPLTPPVLVQRGERHVVVDPTPLPTPVAPPTPTPRPVAAPQIVKGNGQLLWPVPGGVITQYYSASHLALDIAAPAGHPVVASDDGVVTWASWRNNGGGLVVMIDHGNGIVTGYNHLGVIGVAVGDTVTRGEQIAQVGCTGNCTGPHVHFEVIVNGTLVNPLRYL
jgi:murein DD-endopeptidase MepM/ murein hydrolase activator NlpD